MAVAAPSRRLMFTFAAFTAAGALGGCGVHLQDDAPSIPGMPRRPALPEEEHLRYFASLWVTSSEPLLPIQGRALRAGMVAAGVAPSTANSAPDQHPNWRTGQTEEARTLRAALLECPAALLGVLAGVIAQRHAARFPLLVPDRPKGAEPDDNATPSDSIATGRVRPNRRDATDSVWPDPPASQWRDPATALPALAALRQGQARIQVCAPKLSKREREVLAASSGQLITLTRVFSAAAGATAPPPELGYQAAPPTDKAAARREILDTFQALTGALASVVAALVDDRPSAMTTTYALGALTSLAQGWGAAPAALPGYTRA